jgi:hypothetical protein
MSSYEFKDIKITEIEKSNQIVSSIHIQSMTVNTRFFVLLKIQRYNIYGYIPGYVVKVNPKN